MASISWLDKIPLFLSPFPSLSLYSFLAQELSSDCITQLGWGSCPLTLFLFFCFFFCFFYFPPYACTDNSKKMKSCFSKVNWFPFCCIACIIAKQRRLLHCVVFEVSSSKTLSRVDWIGWAIFFWDKRRRLKQKQNTVHDNVLLVIDWKAGFVTVIIPASCILLVIEEKVIKVELI